MDDFPDPMPYRDASDPDKGRTKPGQLVSMKLTPALARFLAWHQQNGSNADDVQQGLDEAFDNWTAL